MALKDILSDFPAREQFNYLSTASIGLVPNPVIEILKEYLITLSQGGTASFDEELEVLIYDNLRKEGTTLFHCNPEDVAVFNSVSEAMNIVAWSLKKNDAIVVQHVTKYTGKPSGHTSQQMEQVEDMSHQSQHILTTLVTSHNSTPQTQNQPSP